LPADPLQFDMRQALQRWPRALLEKYAGKLLPAGVLVPILIGDEGMSVLFTRRSASLSQHAGQVSFPGGRMEAGDANVQETALRETFEEIGIEPQRVEVAGYLDTSPTVSGYAVTPVIGFVRAGYCLAIDRAEVDQVFEVPLAFLLQPDNVQTGVREFDGYPMPVAEFHYGEQRIWGATAHILIMLRDRIIY
jgi:8-oxo-dGTP pyrophosphatase MutT (NUDIX family)